MYVLPFNHFLSRPENKTSKLNCCKSCMTYVWSLFKEAASQIIAKIKDNKKIEV